MANLSSGAEPTVAVRGEAQLEGPPDLATLSATVHSSGSHAESVRAELARASGRIRALLDAQSEAIARYNTSGLHVAPVFQVKSGTKITGYRGTLSTSIEVIDFEALSRIVTTLAPLPNLQLDGPWWSMRPDNPLYRQVRLAAVVDGRRRAGDYAAAVQKTVGELLEISDLDSGGFAPRAMRAARGFAMDAAESQPAFDFEPAVQTVTGQVLMRFALVTRSSRGAATS